MLKDAQLFEALGFFEWRRRPRHELREKCASVRVQTDVAQGLRARRAAIRGIAMHWNQRAREIERAAIDTEDDFDKIRIISALVGGKRRRDRRNISPW